MPQPGSVPATVFVSKRWRVTQVRGEWPVGVYAAYSVPFATKDYFKSLIPPQKRWWVPEQKIWLVNLEVGLLDALEAAVEAGRIRIQEDPALHGKGMEAMKMQDKAGPTSPPSPGPGSHYESFAEFFHAYKYQSRPRDPVPPASPANAFDVLCITPSAPLEVGKAAYRALALLLHPDNGGSHEAMQNLNKAWAEVEPKLKSGKRS